MTPKPPPLEVRRTREEDIPTVIDICREVYPDSPPWNETQLRSHLKLFPEGQLLAVDARNGRIAGVAASLVVYWDDYDITDSWRDFTDHGMFTNHDPVRGRTLYGAEVMVRPTMQRRGVGTKLYEARRDLARSMGLLRIRAGARLRGYHLYANRMSAEEYVVRVVRGEIKGPTLTFQLNHGFHVLSVVHGYLPHDPESLGWAAVIEWLNEEVAKPADYADRNLRFERPGAVNPA
ncbi:MAG: GNAT family N-acetyltransferase [Bryobacteraceae bacterium]